MTVKTATDRNFRRAKVKPVKKRSWSRRALLRGLKVLLVATLVVYSGYLTLHWVLDSSTLQVRRITVNGTTRLSAGEVQALVDGLRGTNILAADLSRYRRRLLESPWVGDAALRRILPSTIEIFVSERSPVGVCRLGGDIYLLDRGGMIIDEFGPKYADFDLPLIDGVVRKQGSADPVIDGERTALAVRVIDALAPHKALATRLSQIDVSSLHDAVVLLDDDPAYLHLGTERFVERLKVYLEIGSALRERVPELDYVDLRFGSRVYVRAAGGKTLHEVPAAPQGTSGQGREF